MRYYNPIKKPETLRGEIYCNVEKLIEDKIISLSIVQRAILEDIMYRTLVFNQSLFWNDSDQVYIVKNVQDLIKIYRLRSKIYKSLEYDKEFPEPIAGINFDEYDEHSAILFTINENQVTGTCRIIFDTEKKLPIDKNYSLDSLRRKGKKLTELSRLIIDRPETGGLGKEFKYLTSGVFRMLKINGITKIVSVIKEEHFALYSKFGGFEKKALLTSYGELNNPFLITLWDITKVSHFFNKLFLDMRK